MGGLWAGRIAAAGFPTSVVEVSEATVEAINQSGLVVEEGDTVISSRPKAARTAESLPAPADVVFMFVKGPHTRAAAAGLGGLVGDRTTVVTLQNGWGNATAIAEFVPATQIVAGVTYEGAMIVAPGRVRHNGSGPTYLGPYLDQAPLERAEEVAAIMAAAGFQPVATAAVKTEVWRKLVLNAACLPVSALTGLRTSQLVEPGPVCDLIDALARETVAVARAQGYDIDEQERIERIHAVLSAAGRGIPSMLADALARRATEIDSVNGAVVRAGHELGVPVPRNEAMISLVRGLEQSWSAGD
jgi:2-dehydropantoate 2-reductase